MIGLLGRVLAEIAELKIRALARERDARALDEARRLDAEDVGRRADRRRERRARAVATAPEDASPNSLRGR